MNQMNPVTGSCFELSNSNGCTVGVASLGAGLRSLRVPDQTGMLTEVVLGLENEESYRRDERYLGVTIGRYSGRIARGEFRLGGAVSMLGRNEWPNHIHGGSSGLYRRYWQAEEVTEDSVVFFCHSPHGEEGFPGNLDVRVRYFLREDNALQIDYTASSDADTIINLTNHAYFNLLGHDSGSVLGHTLQLTSDRIAELDAESIPTGRFLTVAGLPFDFRDPATIGEKINQPHPQLDLAGGFDHAWILDGGKAQLHYPVATLYAAASKICMRLFTDQPSVQFYSGNNLPHEWAGRNGASYGWRQGLCLETQHLPNSPNESRFPSTLLQAGQRFESRTVYDFSVGFPGEWA